MLEFQLSEAVSVDLPDVSQPLHGRALVLFHPYGIYDGDEQTEGLSLGLGLGCRDDCLGLGVGDRSGGQLDG